MLASSNPERKRLAEVAQSLVLASKAPNTLKKYGYAFSSWEKWIGVDKSMRASPQDVGLYLASLVEKGKSPATLQAALYGIRWYLTSAGVDDPTSHPFPASIIEACKGDLRNLKSKNSISRSLV